MGAVAERIGDILSRSPKVVRPWKSQKKVLTRDKVHVVPRVQILRDLEGWYEYCQTPIFDHPISVKVREILKDDYESAVFSQMYCGMKLSKFLVRKAKMESDEVSIFVNMCKKGEFKLSCSYNDILRVADTHHYDSCMKHWRGTQLLRDLADPDMAVVFILDVAGKMQCRMFVRVLVKDDKPILGFYRIYGSGFDHDAIKAVLSSKIDCAPLNSRIIPGDLDNIVFSFSNVFNPAVAVPVWSDHGCHYVKELKKLAFTLDRRSVAKETKSDWPLGL